VRQIFGQKQNLAWVLGVKMTIDGHGIDSHETAVQSVATGRAIGQFASGRGTLSVVFY
jgi:hypothetical protein